MIEPRQQRGPPGAGVHAAVMPLHAWLEAHDYNYYSINSLPRLGSLDRLLDRVRPLGIAWRHLFRLCPFNVRPLFGSESVEDPESTILLARAYGQLQHLYGEVFDAPYGECRRRLHALGDRGDGIFAVPQRRRLRTLNYSTLESEISPLLTAWAGSAFLERATAGGERESWALAARVAAYFLRHHPRDTSDQGVYFYYTPRMRKRVFNASAEMSAFLAEYGALSGDAETRDLGLQGIRWILGQQNADGSWFYGEGRWGRYIDNFHTAFILLALCRVLRVAPEPAYATALARGLQYYVSRLFEPQAAGLRPVRYDGRYPPLNSTIFQRADLRDCAVSMILFCHLGGQDPRYEEMARGVLKWTVGRMYADPWFHPEILWYGKNRNPYINFQAWMLLALALICQHRQVLA